MRRVAGLSRAGGAVDLRELRPIAAPAQRHPNSTYSTPTTHAMYSHSLAAMPVTGTGTAVTGARSFVASESRIGAAP